VAHCVGAAAQLAHVLNSLRALRKVHAAYYNSAVGLRITSQRIRQTDLNTGGEVGLPLLS
jgi:hypothetical protein